jgi:hypothetical protein
MYIHVHSPAPRTAPAGRRVAKEKPNLGYKLPGALTVWPVCKPANRLILFHVGLDLVVWDNN